MTFAAPWVVFVFVGLTVLAATLMLARGRGRAAPVEQPRQPRIRVQTQRMGSNEAPLRGPTLQLFSGATGAALEQLAGPPQGRRRQTRVFL
jgi:hypothetical protein